MSFVSQIGAMFDNEDVVVKFDQDHLLYGKVVDRTVGCITVEDASGNKILVNAETIRTIMRNG